MRLRLHIALLLSLTALNANGAEDRVHFGPFGEVALYLPQSGSGRVVLFVSGDGGWNKGVVDMARALASEGMTVAGIDITNYLKHLESSDAQCAYPAADFEALSQYIQKKLDHQSYQRPLLVGYSSGATLVYATVAQSPDDTFAGALSLGFCPDLQLLKPLCHGAGLETRSSSKAKGVDVLPSPHLRTPWIALQGDVDQVCDPGQTTDFVGRVGAGRLIALSKVGHGFSVQKNWMPQFLEAARSLNNGNAGAPAAKTLLAGLPVVRVPASDPKRKVAAILISGDGGWAGLDKQIADSLAGAGIEVMGLDSLRYFWKQRSPDEASSVLARMLDATTGGDTKTRAIVIGYSFGADVLPFMINRLPDSLQRKIAAVALLGPGPTAEFEFHVAGWLGRTAHGAAPTFPEAEQMRVPKILCVHGEKEKESLCRRFTSPSVQTLMTKGSHHFGGEYESIADAILRLAQ